ncbi:MAG: spore maturation protein [Clostridia bacterium]|nr:spore maturation protein [Clostridia bacterium]
MTAYIVPALILFIAAFGAYKRTDIYAALTEGARAGMKVCASIFPAVLIMLTAISMVRASGAIETLAGVCAPLLRRIGIPEECLPLVLLRPFSGSGALSVGSEVIRDAGADSLTGRIAAVMLGSSETSFYTIAVYSAYLKLKDTGCTLKAAMLADAAAFIMSGVAVRLLMK